MRKVLMWSGSFESASVVLCFVLLIVWVTDSGLVQVKKAQAASVTNIFRLTMICGQNVMFFGTKS